MRTRWEYLVVQWTYTTNFASKGPDEPQTWESTYSIARAGAEPEKRSGDLRWVDFLNELGEEGWEMVSESNRNSVIYNQSHGWTNVGSPISIVWAFKRSVD